MKFIFINNSNVDLLKKFINLNNSNFFRYYDSRNTNVIENHIATILLLEENDIIGYGHLDFENKIWLGICVLEKYTGKGYGKIIIKKLIEISTKNNIEIIYLTVDKTNKIALNFYEKYDFKICGEFNYYYKMSRTNIEI